MTKLDELIKETLVFIAQKGWTQSHEGFFAALVMFLGEKLNVEYVLVDELLPDHKRAKTVGLYASGKIIPDVEYDLAGTPCENVMGKQLCCYPQGIQRLFPKDLMLEQMAAESYLGLPLWDSKGNPIGLIAVMGQKPIENREQAESILQMVAVRCAHELERKRSEEERRQIETDLLRYQKLESIGSLAGGVAHDMNNVLAAIMGVTEVMKGRLAADAVSAKNLDLILKAAARGRKLVKGLTDFSRDQLADARPVDLNELLRQEIELLQRTTLQKIDLVLDLEEPLPAVRGEPASLSNVLMNLCLNAVDAMPDGGRLELRSRRLSATQVEISVQDTGCGMSQEVMAKAMDPYFTTKPLGKGTGLGLSIVYGAMKAHGGTVLIHSEPGAGARFILQFPVEATGGHPEVLRDSRVLNPSRALRVLLVDDEELVRESSCLLFGHLGHLVTATSGGQEALDLLKGGLEVDLVILDQNMPGMTGVEALARIRATRPDVPVVICTGLIDRDVDAATATSTGVSVLRKPFTTLELLATIQASCP